MYLVLISLKPNSAFQHQNLATHSLSRLAQVPPKSILVQEGDDVTTAMMDVNDARECGAAVTDRKKAASTSAVVILALCWGVAFLSALDRVAMSVALLPISQEYGYTESTKGGISSLFSIGYALAILPSGFVLSVASPRLVMATGIAAWSLATLATPITAGMSGMIPLLAARATVGAAESVVLPSIQRFLSSWVPPDQKSIAVAAIFSGFQCGTIGAYLISPYVMEWTEGWKGIFYTYGTIGLMAVVPWLVIAKDSPNGLSEHEIGQKEGDASIQDVLRNLRAAPWDDMLRSTGVQAIILSHAASHWGLYINLAWAPTFYAEQYGMNVRDSALLSILPSVAGVIGGLVAGGIADKAIQSLQVRTDEAVTNIRKTFQAISLLGPAICLSVLASHIPEHPLVAQSLLTGTVGLQAFNAAGYGAGVQEKAGEKWSGLLYSLTSLPGVIFGSIGVYLTGQILDATHQDWSYVFALNACVDVLGATAFVALYNSTMEFA